jgi:hypothetical protein
MDAVFVPTVRPVFPVKCAGPTDKVAIVGFAYTTRDLAPYDDPSYEIWGLNEEYIIGSLQTKDGLPRWDRWFQMHQRWDFTRLNNGQDPQHFEWLQAQRPESEGGFPIYMQARWDDIPASVPLDLDKLIAYSMGGPIGEEGYYTNSIAIMIAQAVLWGFKRIELYGVEMASGTEWAYQKPCTEYHVGLARAHGAKVIFPETCQITKAKIYGWEVGRMISRIEFEIRQNALAAEEQAAIARLNVALARKAELRRELLEKGEDPLKSEKHTEYAMEEMKAFAAANAISGAKQEADYWISILDQRFLPGAGPDDMPIAGLRRVSATPSVPVDPN